MAPLSQFIYRFYPCLFCCYCTAPVERLRPRWPSSCCSPVLLQSCRSHLVSAPCRLAGCFHPEKNNARYRVSCFSTRNQSPSTLSLHLDDAGPGRLLGLAASSDLTLPQPRSVRSHNNVIPSYRLQWDAVPSLAHRQKRVPDPSQLPRSPQQPCGRLIMQGQERTDPARFALHTSLRWRTGDECSIVVLVCRPLMTCDSKHASNLPLVGVGHGAQWELGNKHHDLPPGRVHTRSSGTASYPFQELTNMV